jgi:hypothetical protein
VRLDALLNNKVAVSSRERTSQVYLDKLRTAMKNASEGEKRCIYLTFRCWFGNHCWTGGNSRRSAVWRAGDLELGGGVSPNNSFSVNAKIYAT